jgi:exopolysaccharide biosynthesis polyprenyl glycosylphosphotransferase
MIRRHITLLRIALMATDAVTAFVLFELIVTIRFQNLDPDLIWLRGVGETQTLAIGYGLLWVSAMWIAGLYRLRTRLTMRGEIRDVSRAAVIAAVLSMSGLLLLNLPPARLVLVPLFIAQPIFSIMMRATLRWFLTNIRGRGYNSRQILIIGAGPAAQEFADQVEQNRAIGLTVMGHLRGPRDDSVALRRPVLGSIDDLESILHSRIVDEVAVCLSPQDWIYVEPATRICEEEGRIVRIVIPPLGGILSGGRYEELGGSPVVTFLYGPDRVLGLALKRSFDIVGSLLLIALLSPVMLITALLVRVIDGAPVIFQQERVGLQGRPFGCRKFRTMIPGADEQQPLLESLNEVHGPAFKIANDPRVTRLGHILRRYSLDELPQLFNVLVGDMSLVGPRPAPAREVDRYDMWHRRRLSMRPGLTGLWQIQARSDTDFNRRAALDLSYIDRWSLWLDVMIILRTVPAVVSQPGR